MNLKYPLTILFLVLTLYAFSQDQMRVHIIDVGQGSAALVEFPCGVIMIDTGGETNTEFNSTDSLMNYLEKFFIRRGDLHNTIDLLVISHPHKDHTLGVKSIIKKYAIKNVVTNGQSIGSGRAGQIALHKLVADAEDTPSTSDDIGYFEAVLTAIPKNGVTNNVIDAINCQGTNPLVKILWGQSTKNMGWAAADFSDENNHSVVCRIDYGNASILFTGDLEIPAIKSLLSMHTDKKVFDVDVYVTGHHGSKNGSTAQFIKATSPELAVLSFGDPDRQLSWTAYAYGHPNKGIIDLLSDNVTNSREPKLVMVGDGAENFEHQTISKAVYGVGWDGTIVLNTDPTGQWKVQESRPLLNINLASRDELIKLPAISAVRAKAIIDYRANQPIKSFEDLDRVPGIGTGTITLIRPLIRF